MSKAKSILAVDKEQELLQSFLRTGAAAEEESQDEAGRRSKGRSHKPPIWERRESTDRGGRGGGRDGKQADDGGAGGGDGQGGKRGNRIEAELRAARKRIEEQIAKKKKPKENFVDFYTDKDRAAAVSAGAFDIKQSLQIKQKQDRNEALLIPDEADISSVIALGLKEIKNANPENAIHFFCKALELNSTDINALISRSKCYLLLGEASKALQDAETALGEDKNNIRAIYQKAESLYYLGQFEQSLMFFHRGLRARPELALFRLGVQKTQEAIENTIGSKPGWWQAAPSASAPKSGKARKSGEETPKSQAAGARIRQKPSRVDLERRNARKLLGELCVDKEYLEKLLLHPDLVRADTHTESISAYAREAVEFLNKRQEFWRQQRPCTALPNHKNLPHDALPKWF
ncbi:LOW QUALITY PROTEIN: outer dynein arm-docking complex subunit 4 [Drosophila gunungcola]|uniref:LOW QUALITY PROTEIN: outer dynein arm-docking complex subunit 4 n=1 Tax=Drosophila gunungcola TaxID=103775 RepID=UPI0022DF3040|nr:LOW QUALITY PROTEIN: outer dynein arm-docking complex subunit 4 [Drosophila gunungcola]